MTDSVKSVSGYGSSDLAVAAFDQPVSWSRDCASSRTNFGQSADQVIRSLSSALETVELEYDEPCAEALRRAIAARLAGLRPKTRDAAHGSEADDKRSIRPLQKWRIKRVIEYVDANLSSKVSLLDLAAVAGLSRMHFASQFRAATGLRPHEFLLRQRVRRAEELLRRSPMAIVEVALAVGFQTQAHFTTVFKRFTGSTPREWRAANQISPVQPDRNGARPWTTAVL